MLEETLQKADLLVVVDHGKGFVRRMRSFLRPTTIPILLDPSHNGGWTDYGPVELIKATAGELAARVPDPCTHDPVGSQIDSVREVASQWVITDGPRGLYYSPAPGERHCRHVPTHPVDPVVDSTGCGDTVMACLALGRAEGLDLQTTCERAVKAAATQAQRVGIATGVIARF